MMEPNDDATKPNTTVGVVTRASPWSVEETQDRFTTLLEQRGLKLFGVIDQQREATAVGLELRPTRLMMFGSPKAGTPVMEAIPLVALDLPLKVLIWAGDESTKVSYPDREELARRYALAPDLASKLSGVPGLIDAMLEG